MASLKPWFLLTQVYSCLSFFTTSYSFVNDLGRICFQACQNQVKIHCANFGVFFLNLTCAAHADLLLVYIYLHKPTRVTTALEVLDCPKVRNYLLSRIWKFRNLSFPILQNSSLSFPTQATVSLIKILYIESPWKLSGGKRFLGQASWVFLSWIFLTIAQTIKQKSLNI